MVFKINVNISMPNQKVHESLLQVSLHWPRGCARWNIREGQYDSSPKYLEYLCHSPANLSSANQDQKCWRWHQMKSQGITLILNFWVSEGWLCWFWVEKNGWLIWCQIHIITGITSVHLSFKTCLVFGFTFPSRRPCQQDTDLMFCQGQPLMQPLPAVWVSWE